jgi:DNA-binding SARP family transcriptional activator
MVHLTGLYEKNEIYQDGFSLCVIRFFSFYLLMLKLAFALLFLVGGLPAFAQPYGLQFSSHEVIPEKRTSLDITANGSLRLAAETEISFDLMFQPHKNIYFGYVMRLITAGNQHIDIVYNQRSASFNFVNGEQVSGTLAIDTALLLNGWNRFVLRINTTKKKLFFSINTTSGEGPLTIKPESDYRLYFGSNNYEGFQTTDIPPACIKDIQIANDGKGLLSFPLSESEGVTAADTKAHRKALVKNPVWIKPRHQKWENVYSINTKATASVAFDKKREIVYMVAADSLYSFNLTNMAVQAIALTSKRDSIPPGNQSIFIPLTDSLYNFYIDSKQVSRYDSGGRRWNNHFDFKDLTVYWQANKFFSAWDTCLYILGGYGQLQYKNQVQRYHLNSQQWEPVPTTGDFFMPRYMASAGTNEKGDTAYLVGGYGSTSGDQAINPRFTYDFTLFDVRKRSFYKLFQLPEPARQFCFANQMVVDPPTNTWYALVYPTDRFNASLQLIQGTLSAPAYTLRGDSIPYSYYDIASYADLYYCKSSKKLVAVTLYTANNRSEIKIYAIDFPPGVATTIATKPGIGWKPYAIFVLVLLGAGAWIVARRKKVVTPQSPAVVSPATQPAIATVDTPELEPMIKASSIYLFGNFEVYDNATHDVTTQFTPLLKELLILIVTYTIRTGKGIPQEKLFEILWRDKQQKDAKNNYSVNIAKLKPILESIGACHIEKVNGKIQLVAAENAIYIDYLTFNTIVRKPVCSPAEKQTLLKILERGSFLNEVNYSWLDDIKSEVSSLAIDWLLPHFNTHTVTDSHSIIRIANAVFQFDQLNETALEYKCKALIAQGRYGLALETFQKFEKEYEHSYGEKPGKSFNEIANQ